MSDDRLGRLSRAWDEAADGYERYFVPRFAPWVESAVSGLPTDLPDGPVIVPCCGTFPELPFLADAFPGRRIVGVDISLSMVERARSRAEPWPSASVECADASDLSAVAGDGATAIVSVFGLQQLPDPVATLAAWTRMLRPDGWLSVVYWPPASESHGPFALLDAVRDEASEPEWPDLLADAVTDAGVRVLADVAVSHKMTHPDAATFWLAMAEGGPLRSLVLARGDGFVDRVRARFLERAPAGAWQHRPSARWVLATRD